MMASLLVANFARVTPFDDVFFLPFEQLGSLLGKDILIAHP